MGLWARTGRFSKAALLVGAGVLGGGAALAVAGVPDSNGVIHACYSVDSTGNPVTTGGANLTVIDPSVGQTCTTTPSPAGPPPQKALDWNQSGPQGPPGAPGGQGSSGPPGPTQTVVPGNTLLLAGGQVITVAESTEGATGPSTNETIGGSNELILGSGPGALVIPIDGYHVVSAGGTTVGITSGGGAAHTSIRDISVLVPYVAKLTAKLLEDGFNGAHIKQATITLATKKGQLYLVIRLSDVLVSGVQSAHFGGLVPQDNLSLHFGSETVNYYNQKSKLPPYLQTVLLHHH